MEAEFGRSGSGGGGGDGRFIKECKEVRDFLRSTEVRNENAAKGLWQFSERQVEALEKEGAVRRALARQEGEERGKGKEKSKGDFEGIGMESQGKKGSGSRRSRKAS